MVKKAVDAITCALKESELDYEVIPSKDEPTQIIVDTSSCGSQGVINFFKPHFPGGVTGNGDGEYDFKYKGSEVQLRVDDQFQTIQFEIR